MSNDKQPVLDEQTLTTVLLERGWASEDEIEAAQIDIDMGMADGPLEVRLFQKGVITEKDLTTLRDICSLPSSIAGFKILKTIGAGAMGVVYLAEEADSGDKIALKVINSKHCDDVDFINRFHRETKAVASLTHKNIAGSLGSGKYKDELYLAMEYIDGPSLSEILADHGPVPETYALRTIMQIASGLEYAHEKSGLIHRDIKPANILIERSAGGKKDLNLYIDQDTAKIIDFGLAKSTDGNDDLTMTGLTMGTPHYMAPEQIRGDSNISHQVDIYALGATLYHLLTGEPPFDGNSPGAIMLAHINNPIPDPSAIIPSIKPATVDLVKMCLAKNCKDRFGTFRAVIKVCENALKAEGDNAPDMRVLRKPLKIQSTNTVRKNRDQRSPSSSAPTQAHNDAETMEIDSDSFLKAHQQSTSYHKKGTDSMRKHESTGYLAAESALRKIQTERIRRESTKRISRPNGEKAKKVATTRFTPDQSAAFDEDPINDLGSGKLPWLVLSGAVIALVLSIAARFL